MKKFGNITLFSITSLAFIVIYFPIFVITLLSFNDSTKDYTFVGFSFRWYIEIFKDDRLLEAIINTISVAVLSTLIATIIGTLTAIGINSLKKNMRVRMMILNNVPVINPDIVTGISLMLVFSLLPLSFGMGTMLMGHIFFSTPFVVLTVMPKLKELDENLFDAALDLGCNRFQAIYKVIIPSIKTGIIAGALIAFTMSIDDFVISYFTTGNGFQNVSLWIYSRLGRRNFSPAVYAYNTLVIFITITILTVVNRLNNNKSIKIKRRLKEMKV
ncbi:MAG: ABC transporter permease [Bacilli bacterium]|nr:ABC transporter permease [Bacilli bacterium]